MVLRIRIGLPVAKSKVYFVGYLCELGPTRVTRGEILDTCLEKGKHFSKNVLKEVVFDQAPEVRDGLQKNESTRLMFCCSSQQLVHKLYPPLGLLCVFRMFRKFFRPKF